MVFIVVLFFTGVLSFLEVGRRLGKRNISGKAYSLLSSAVFALMGLLIAFSFSGAEVRFETKRQLIVTETIAIQTAYLRIDLLPLSKQEPLRGIFRKYLDARLAFYRDIADQKEADVQMDRARASQRDVWAQAITECREMTCAPANTFLMSSLNAMIDASTACEVALKVHPPKVVLLLLAVLPLICSLLAGYDAAGNGRCLPAYAGLRNHFGDHRLRYSRLRVSTNRLFHQP
jgi:hypothetical protein